MEIKVGEVKVGDKFIALKGMDHVAENDLVIIRAIDKYGDYLEFVSITTGKRFGMGAMMFSDYFVNDRAVNEFNLEWKKSMEEFEEENSGYLSDLRKLTGWKPKESSEVLLHEGEKVITKDKAP